MRGVMKVSRNPELRSPSSEQQREIRPDHPDSERTTLVSREVTSVLSRCSIGLQMHERLCTCLLIVPVQNER